MCDYCGCREQPEIDELSEEHDRLLDLAYALRRLARHGTHAAVLEIVDGEFAPLLAHHTDKEERGLFTQLRSNYEADGRLDTLTDEHRELEGLLASVRARQDGWQQVLIRLVDDLARHILDEEVDLFPYAMYELGEAQWARVNEVHAASPGPSVRAGCP
jgi:hemerythrin-like domain-containing protein